jgi:hypothetical protein
VGTYKRAVLTSYGEQLPDKLGRAGGLLNALQAKGHRFYLEPEARIYHANPSRFLATVGLRFNAGRLYGAVCAANEGWSPLHRLLYFFGGPLIPLVRFRRLYQELFHSRERPENGPRLWLALFLGLILDALGQMAGYILGSGGSEQRLVEFEHDRLRHLMRQDRQVLAR